MKEVTVAARLNRLPISGIHRKATILIGIGLFFDIYDIFLSGVLGTVLAKQFGVNQKELPLLVGSSFLGMFLGAIILGRMADKIGRKKAYLLNLAIYSFFTLFGAFSDSVGSLIIFRFLAGLGLGAETPLSDTYLSELLPSSHRGRYIAWAYTISFSRFLLSDFWVAVWFPFNRSESTVGGGYSSLGVLERLSSGFCVETFPNLPVGWSLSAELRKRGNLRANLKKMPFVRMVPYPMWKMFR
ncbi:hypothetical protein DNHGIG_19200 [Collibacillus ludicampi]|uniref:Major facilitator superfamily (MFS) profile domain-containing protein n=1 Tax=Collibacillus ludicampi TaxID=2771369 RepID=A0AAV4LEX1_9BACL|nr:hypothetical protein DNHGIG_19200 [Collibacillus ludicampi]